MEVDKVNAIGTTDDFKVNVTYDIHKKKKHRSFEVDFVCIQEMEKDVIKKVNVYLSFEGLTDKTFSLRREFELKKVKKGELQNNTFVNKLLISENLKTKNLIAYAH